MDTDISNRTYTFYLNNPHPDILHYYLLDNNPLYESFVEQVKNEYQITFKRSLTSQELSEFTNWITTWVQPSIYLIYDHAETYTLTTDKINSSDLSVVNTFIMPRYNLTSSSVILGSLKTLIHVSVHDITSLINLDENIIGNIKIQLYCNTKKVVIHHEDVSISNTIYNWKQQALGGKTGLIEDWIPYQMYGLDNVLPDYDCIWQWKLSTNSPNVYVALNSLQRIYFTRLTR